jgi:hypothetical protein
MLDVHAIGALVWLIVKCTLRTLRSKGQIQNDTGDHVSHFLMRGCAALAALTLVILMIKPNTLHAPAPSHEQFAQSTHLIGQIQSAQAMRASLLAEAQTTKEAATSPASEVGGISNTKRTAGDSVNQGSRSRRDGGREYCKISEQLSAFMSPSQLRTHFKRCNANDE